MLRLFLIMCLITLVFTSTISGQIVPKIAETVPPVNPTMFWLLITGILFVLANIVQNYIASRFNKKNGNGSDTMRQISSELKTIHESQHEIQLQVQVLKDGQTRVVEVLDGILDETKDNNRFTQQLLTQLVNRQS